VLSALDVLTDEILVDARVWRSAHAEHPVPLVVALEKMHSPLFDLTTPAGRPTLDSLYKRDGGTCLYCLRTRKDLLRAGRGEIFTIDHIVPRWRHRKQADAHVWSNVALACNTCNC